MFSIRIVSSKTCYKLSQIVTRCAGHAKWQNIRSAKQANDQLKSKTCFRYVQLVRKAIVSNNMQTDPRLNKQLGDVLHEASKMNVPKATLERAIARAKNIKILSFNLEIQGPGKSSIILRCEADNVNTAKKEVKRVCKKFDSHIMPEDTIIKMFKSQGIVRTSSKSTDGQDIDIDAAEEAAINANAEEVNMEVHEDVQDEEYAKTFLFITNHDQVNQCKGELEKQKFKVLSCETELVPYNKIDFGEEITEIVDELTIALKDLQEVVAIYTNIA